MKAACEPIATNATAPSRALDHDGGADGLALPAWLATLVDLSGDPSAAANQSTGHSSMLDLAYEEYCKRRDGGEELDADAYCDQFPHLQSSLGRLIRAHRYLEEHPALLGNSWPEPGQSFLGFELQKELGRGAFARVFLSTQPTLGNRLVAVKVSRSGGAEANTLGRINHPNIVPVYSTQEDPATKLTAICMPYLGSATLCNLLDHIKANPELPHSARAIQQVVGAGVETTKEQSALTGSYVDAVCAIGAQLAEALQFIHDRKIFHRDLKPSNVLMTPSGRPMLLDFNLCDDPQVVDTRLGGTLPYMPPEQLLATGRDQMADTAGLDARSDLYSLGVMLFELLTGQHPFGPLPLELAPREARQLLLERQQAGALSLRRLNPEVDSKLAHLVERCLAYNPKARPQRAAELNKALKSRRSPLQRSRRWVGRHPWLTATAAVCLLSLTSAVTAFWPRPEPEDIRLWRLGQEAYHAGRFENAVDQFNRLDVIAPARAEVLFARARAFQQWGETDRDKYIQAASDYFKANQLQQDDRAAACLFYCELRLKQTQIAGLHLREVKRFESAANLNNLGFYFVEQGKLAEAIGCLDEAIKRNDHLQAAFHNRAMAHLRAAQKIIGGSANPQTKAAMDNAARYMESLVKAKTDVQQAVLLAKGNATVELFKDAARICAASSVFEPDDRALAVDYFEAALKVGMDCAAIKDASFALLRADPGLQQTLQNTATDRLQKGFVSPAVPPPTRRILDPLGETR
jgi:serine/threonine protein kinase